MMHVTDHAWLLLFLVLQVANNLATLSATVDESPAGATVEGSIPQAGGVKKTA
jgi:hypothetical protein